MNPFKPRHTFESVVRELVAGLEDGTIVLSNAASPPQSEKQIGAIVLFNNSLGMRMKASPSLCGSKRRYRFVNEWVSLDVSSKKALPIDFSPNQALRGLRVSR